MPDNIYNCSWARQADNSCTLFNVRSAAGFAGFSGPTFTSRGTITSVHVQADADGQHITVTADITFSPIVNGVRTDFIPAEAVYHGRIAPDGVQTEGVYITDMLGNLLVQTEETAVLVRGQICLW